MFSDILTPLPALGIEFDVIKGKGPRIDNPISRWRGARGGGKGRPLSVGSAPCVQGGAAVAALGACSTAAPAASTAGSHPGLCRLQATRAQACPGLHPPRLPPRPAARSMEQVRALAPMDDPLSKLPFVHETLSTLRSELNGTPATLLGFIGCDRLRGLGQPGRAVLPRLASPHLTPRSLLLPPPQLN